MDSNHRTLREQIYSLPCLATSLALHDGSYASEVHAFEVHALKVHAFEVHFD